MEKEIQTLIDKYLLSKDIYETPLYDETSTRIDFLNKLFEIFGWDVDNQKLLPENLREVIHEASVKVEEDEVIKKKKPDYMF
ncbi:MAG: hypothetical protein KH152_09260, partial [Finegoldia magna]|nr:hypothetical protein [Finegoldia magna]